MTLAGIAKFVLGVSLAIAILAGSSVAVALYFMYTVTNHPPKPTFANENVNRKQKAAPASKEQAQLRKLEKSTTDTAKADPAEETKSTELEPGTYRARVSWEQGLSLRAEPGASAERIGGLDYNQQIVVLEESPDKNWQRVRLADSDREGWIKAGNIEKMQ
jgi:hypothetical protein